MRVLVGVGSNLGDRRTNIERGLAEIQKLATDHRYTLASVYENPALLPPNCVEDWNFPFLNLAVAFDYSGTPHMLLKALKEIERQQGRTSTAKWAPRPIDLDILLFGEQVINDGELTIPHPHMTERPFVMAPLKDLIPTTDLPGGENLSVLELTRQLHFRLPQWMQILNLTENSFSDGGRFNSLQSYDEVLNLCLAENIQILDLGAESTRPGAKPISCADEWAKLEPYIRHFHEFFLHQRLRPRLSVDTRHTQTAANAVALGVDVINDVSGLSDPALLSVLRDSSCEDIRMHSLTVPADPMVHLDTSLDPVREVLNWAEERLEFLVTAGIPLSRLIFDPGIGFGKTTRQSLEIIQRFEELQQLPVRLLAGHSRKSFMKHLSSTEASQRDLETLGFSLQLAQKGADIIRVHNAVMHSKAFRGWSHAN